MIFDQVLELLIDFYTYLEVNNDNSYFHLCNHNFDSFISYCNTSHIYVVSTCEQILLNLRIMKYAD